MKFSNETKYSTIELRALFKEVNKHEGIEPRSLRAFTAKVPKWCAPTHFGTVVRGTAWCSLKHIQIGIPKHLLKGERKSMDSFDLLTIPLTQLDTEQVKTVARVYAHELAHIRGVMKHRDMLSWTSLDVDYLGDRTVGLEQ